MKVQLKVLQLIIVGIFMMSCFHKSPDKILEPKTSIIKDLAVKTGLDVLLEKQLSEMYDKRIALVTNQSGINSKGQSNTSLFMANDSINLVKIFTPEHGFAGNIPAGEFVKYDSILSGFPPVISLYGKTKKPTPQMLLDIDIFIYDIQDIGTRYYTYISTLGLVMEAAAEANIPLWILDRPNPIGKKLDGPLLNIKYASFVGKYPIPIQYGMTVAELAKMIVGEKLIDPIPELTVIPMENYRRRFYFDETKLLWTKPSPNIPDLETAIIYPGTCLIEACNVSEGRGTYSPFKQIGAPWINADHLETLIQNQGLSGVTFTSIQFIPKSIPSMSKYPKFENQICNGIKITITDREEYNSILTGITILWSIQQLYPDNLIIDNDALARLWGSDNLLQQLKAGNSPSEITAFYQSDLEQFQQVQKKYLIYQ